MKVRIEIDENGKEEEVIIKCRQLDKNVQKIQQEINDITLSSPFVFYKQEVEYYLPLHSILFFETSGTVVTAHTKEDIYEIKYRLYELEDILPSNFIRVSKSTILNINYIYSIDRNLTASSVVQFQKSHKQVYVSRNYYKALKQKLAERRNYEV